MKFQMLNAKYRYDLESWLKQKKSPRFQINLAQITPVICAQADREFPFGPLPSNNKGKSNTKNSSRNS